MKRNPSHRACHQMSDYLDSTTTPPQPTPKLKLETRQEGFWRFTISRDDLSEGWMTGPFDLVASWISLGIATEGAVKFNGRFGGAVSNFDQVH